MKDIVMFIGGVGVFVLFLIGLLLVMSYNKSVEYNARCEVAGGVAVYDQRGDRVGCFAKSAVIRI